MRTIPLNYKIILALVALVLFVIITLLAVEQKRETAMTRECQEHLHRIHDLKQEWALFWSKSNTDVPTWESLLQDASKPDKGGSSRIFLYSPSMSKIPQCPAGGKYTLNAIGEPPTCSLAKRDHVLQEYRLVDIGWRAL